MTAPKYDQDFLADRLWMTLEAIAISSPNSQFLVAVKDAYALYPEVGWRHAFVPTNTMEAYRTAAVEVMVTAEVIARTHLSMTAAEGVLLAQSVVKDMRWSRGDKQILPTAKATAKDPAVGTTKAVHAHPYPTSVTGPHEDIPAFSEWVGENLYMVVESIRAGKKIYAIKDLRAATAASLLHSKNAVEYLEKHPKMMTA